MTYGRDAVEYSIFTVRICSNPRTACTEFKPDYRQEAKRLTLTVSPWVCGGREPRPAGRGCVRSFASFCGGKVHCFYKKHPPFHFLPTGLEPLALGAQSCMKNNGGKSKGGDRAPTPATSRLLTYCSPLFNRQTDVGTTSPLYTRVI